ncbi:MAG TPA: hypothetical protein VM146_10260 [Steroidobacteraceae bacterium]|nr:hypothetical protein [Steroidobacteraceae bacterium]
MKTLLKLAALGGLTAIAINLYRRKQSRDGDLPDEQSDLGGMDQNMDQGLDQVADTNSVATGDAAAEQSGAQPQDWRGAQNVLGQ